MHDHYLSVNHLVQSISAINQLHQPVHKASSWSPIDDIAVKYHRKDEDLARHFPDRLDLIREVHNFLFFGILPAHEIEE